MKKLCILSFLILLCFNYAFGETYTTSDLKVFESDNHKFYGLKNPQDEIIADSVYRKMIRLGDNAWIFQKKNYKFGLMDCQGNILVNPDYAHAERLFDKWVKFGNDKDYGIYDENGKTIVPPKFKSIEPLFGHKFLTYQNYKYGIYNDKGEELLPNEYDFIYMPTPKIIRIKKNANWYEVEQIAENTEIQLFDKTIKEIGDENFEITQLAINTGCGMGYTVVTATDYALKIISSISEAYEDTIDELMLSKGVEAVSVFVKLSWIPKFPVIYVKKYYENLVKPDNSPLSEVRSDIKKQIK